MRTGFHLLSEFCEISQRLIRNNRGWLQNYCDVRTRGRTLREAEPSSWKLTVRFSNLAQDALQVSSTPTAHCGPVLRTSSILVVSRYSTASTPRGWTTGSVESE